RATGKTLRTPKRKPSLITYLVGNSRYLKLPDAQDMKVLGRIGRLGIPSGIPTVEIPPMHMTHERARMDYSGVTRVHHFFLPHAMHGMSALWEKAKAHAEPRTRGMLLYFVEQAIWGMSILARYAPTHFSQVNQYLNGVYYVGSQHAECSPWYILEGKLSRLTKAFGRYRTSP